MMVYRLIALLAGFFLDLYLGEPKWLYHPVVLIGKLITFLEKPIRKLFPETKVGELAGGTLEVLLVCLFSFGVPFLVLKPLYAKLPVLGLLLESFWCFRLFATKALKTESMKVYDCLTEGTLEDARKAVSGIVGRDTRALDEAGVTKAAVETIAENSSDGVLAPMFYMVLGGVSLMFLYKAINTMDSMLGYKNESYLYFGRCAAKLDDAANFIPARLSGWLMVLSTAYVRLNMLNAARIYRRDRKNHTSPNAGHTEAAMAGALDVQLGGNAYYFGKLYEKPLIGDPNRSIEAEDIVRADQLLYATAFLGLGISAAVLFLASVF